MVSAEAQGPLPNSHGFGQINVLSALELIEVCFFKASKRENLLTSRLSFKRLS